ncbi:MAG TPA: serine/threonine-protein kinase [Candidatus Dormibacteraeota bacterium]|jgi:serine/threonine-protein kinase|nr:serine/threonine-protein kinase [Candidatus Dormibacteraeota bacterium]
MGPGILDRFQIEGVLGQGASGTVYLALQPELGRRVALKELSPALVQDPTFLERFREEARIMARLDNPNCVRVFAFYEEPGRAVLVSEYIEGASLRRVVAQAGRLTPEQSLGVVKGALTGLGQAHALGLVHRDIKPENVLADREGVSKLADFGQAVFAAGPGAAGGISAGTPAYMSPEAVMGGVLDFRTDIYSCGAMLFDLLTGRPPFVADNPLAQMRMHVTDPVPDPRAYNPDLPPEVSAMLGRSLAKDPGGRQQSAAELLAELEAAAVAGYGEDWEKRSSIKPLVSGLLGLLGAGLVSAGGALASSSDVAAGFLGGGKLLLGGVLGTMVVAGGIGGFILFGSHQPAPEPSPSPITSVVTLPSSSPSDVPSPSPEPSPSESPSPTGSPSPTPSASATPTMHPTVHPTIRTVPTPTPTPTPWTLSVTQQAVYWAACTQPTTTATSCNKPAPVPPGNSAETPCTINNSGNTPCPNTISSYAWAELMETFTWKYNGAAPGPVVLGVSWTVNTPSGATCAQGGPNYRYTLPMAGGTHSAPQSPPFQPNCEVQTSSGSYSGYFNLSWTDGAGNHTLTSNAFYWALG